MEIKTKLHNRWDIVKTNVKTGKTEKYEGENIILNQFWARYISTNSATCFSYIHIGSGTATPVATNTQLGAKWANYASANEIIDTSRIKSDGYLTRQLSCRIEANTYVGQTISEVGFAYGTAATNLMTHSLLRDMNGNAVTITINADEVVDVYGTVYFKIGYRHNGNTVSVFGSYTENVIGAMIGKVPYNTLSVYGPTRNTYIPEKTLFPATNQTPTFATGVSNAAISYDTANKKVIFTFPNSTISTHNIPGGIGSAVVGGGLQILLPCTGFTQSAITKEVVGTGDGTKVDFQTAFGFVLDNGTAKIYVNDIEVATTIDFNTPHPSAPLSACFNYSDDSDSFIGITTVTGTFTQFENPLYATRGIDSINCRSSIVAVSDDNSTWVDVATRTATTDGVLTIPAGSNNKRYFKIRAYAANNFKVNSVSSTSHAASTNVHLSVAPAIGDTVAVTYQPNVLAKDSNHMLKDVSFAFGFSEYTPA